MPESLVRMGRFVIVDYNVWYGWQVYSLGVLYFFFFQAEDGIRDYKVTGVQTCALPISIGVIGLKPLQPGIAEIKRLYVMPEARGTGLGRTLAERAMAEARIKSYERVDRKSVV